MSFSSEVKNELLKYPLKPCCLHARSYGLLLFGRTFSPQELSILTSNIDIAEHYCDSVQLLSGKRIGYSQTDGGKFKVLINDSKIIGRIFDNLGLDTQATKKRINFANFQDSCCFAAFLNGAFLSCGTVTDPNKDYHLEFSVSSKNLCDDLAKIFDEYEPNPKATQRNGSYTLYFKNSTEIEDVLAIMGAQQNSIKFMQTKIAKDINNTVNRKVNFDKANLDRTINAAYEQYLAIVKIYKTIGEEGLPAELREIAKIRYKNRELSNSQIAAMLSDSISLSGVNHRFKRIIKIAQEINE